MIAVSHFYGFPQRAGFRDIMDERNQFIPLGLVLLENQEKDITEIAMFSARFVEIKVYGI